LDHTKSYIEKIHSAEAQLAGHAHKLDVKLQGWCGSGLKKKRSHVALCERNSGTKSGRELFKSSKDLASLPVCTRKKIFYLGDADFF